MPRTAQRVETNPQATTRIQLLTAKQVLNWLGISRTTLWLLMRKVGLLYVKYGKGRGAALRFSSESIITWIAQKAYQTMSEKKGYVYLHAPESPGRDVERE